MLVFLLNLPNLRHFVEPLPKRSYEDLLVSQPLQGARWLLRKVADSFPELGRELACIQFEKVGEEDLTIAEEILELEVSRDSATNQEENCLKTYFGAFIRLATQANLLQLRDSNLADLFFKQIFVTLKFFDFHALLLVGQAV